MYQRLTFNLAGGVRRETLEGRRHVVVPAAILAEGVINGSAGPIFYPEDEIAKAASLWNHKPIVVYHPDKDGVPVSAADPVILNTRGVGRLLGVKYAENKLRAECWMDEERLKAIDGRILNDLEAGKQVEVSTGLELDLEPTPGKWKDNEEYKGVARNHKPDHLAALPDKTGAYSVKMGGGMLTVNRAREPERIQLIAQRSMEDALRRIGVSVAENELSFSDTTRQLCDLLAAKYGEPGKYWEGRVCDTYPGYAIFKGGYDQPYQLIKYKTENDVVSLDGDATEVVMKTEYVAANGAYAVDAGKLVPVVKPPENKETTMAFDKKAHVNNLIANGGGTWAEAHRASLEGLPDDVLERIRLPVQAQNAAPANPVPAAPPVTPEPRTPQTGQPAPAPAQPVHPNVATMTAQQYIANAPTHLRGELQDIYGSGTAERDRLVAAILAYPLNQFPEESLKATPIAQLRMLHNMIPQTPTVIEQLAPLVGAGAGLIPATPSFAGAAGGYVGNMAMPTDILPLPEIDFTPGK